jgi:hypothetical protein
VKRAAVFDYAPGDTIFAAAYEVSLVGMKSWQHFNINVALCQAT